MDNTGSEFRLRIARDLLNGSLGLDGFAPCPGIELHTNSGGHRDFRVMLDGAPTGFCFHSSCAELVGEFNRVLRLRILAAESGDPVPVSPLGDVAMAPVPPSRSRRPLFDPERLADFASRCPIQVDEEWLAERSPVPVRSAGEVLPSGDFLSSLFRPGERVLVFTSQWSQGDFLFVPDAGGYRLAAEPGTSAVESALPTGGPEGVWFLVQPVCGKWRPNPNNRDEVGNVRMGRRHGACVERWPYMVLESDEAPAGEWLRALVQLSIPIVAAYTSGGRSIHALVRVDSGSKGEFDALRDELAHIVCPLGADPAAMTAVRLSRLPGCLRHGKRNKAGGLNRYREPNLQRLIWLNPSAPVAPILELVRP